MAKIKVTKPTPNPDTTPKATAEKTATPKASINRGATTGLRVMQFQDKLLADNLKAKLTDERMLEKMAKEFPNAKGKIFTGSMEERLRIMRIVRTLFNENRHGSQSLKAPEGGVPEFDAKGNIVPPRPRGRAKKNEEAAPATEQPKAKTKAITRVKKVKAEQAAA